MFLNAFIASNILSIFICIYILLLEFMFEICSLEDYGGAITAYSWKHFPSLLAEKLAEMAEKRAQPFTQSQIYMHLDP